MVGWQSRLDQYEEWLFAYDNSDDLNSKVVPNEDPYLFDDAPEPIEQPASEPELVDLLCVDCLNIIFRGQTDRS